MHMLQNKSQHLSVSTEDTFHIVAMKMITAAVCLIV